MPDFIKDYKKECVEDLAQEIAFEVVEHELHVVSDPDEMGKILTSFILKYLEENDLEIVDK